VAEDVGDSYDNALAETMIGRFKIAVIRHLGPWRSLEAVEFATLEWIDRFNHRRLLKPIGDLPAGRGRCPLLQEPAADRPGGVRAKRTRLRENRTGSTARAGGVSALTSKRDFRSPLRGAFQSLLLAS
jgi:hypothetical protein